MTSTKRKTLLFVLAAALILALASAGFISAYAVTADDTVVYPFDKGSGAFKFAPTWTSGGYTAGDTWAFFEIKIGEHALADMDYFALQVNAPSKSFGFTIGALAADNNGRFDTDGDGASVDGNKCYLVKEDGTVKELSILYASITLDKGDTGMLLLPKDQLKWRWNTSEKVKSYYITTNTKYNFDFSLTVGEVGYFKGEPTDAANYHSLWKPELGAGHENYTAEEKAKYYTDNGTISFPVYGDYPFVTGDKAFQYAPTWTGATEASDVMQSLTTPTASSLALDKVKSVAIQIKTDKKVGLVISALNGTNRWTTAGGDGKTVNFVSDNGTKTEVAIKNGGYIEIEGTGAIVIPKECFTGDITSFNQLVFETNADTYNNFKITVGAIGYYGTDDVYHPWYVIPNLAGENSLGITTGLYEKLFVAEHSTVTHPTAPQAPLKSIEVKQTYGDVKVYWQADAQKLESHIFYAGGASGSVAIVKDSYGADALQVQATANNNDGYMAMDVISAVISAEGTKGITFWAKNPSSNEISFNVEMDVKYKPTADAVRYQQTRTNIQQGHRFWLYDVNTGEQTIAMTRPTASLPAHFEGWVRIPFECFNRASWSKGDHTFMFENGVAKADTFISYFAISYDTHTFPINQPFVVNNFGTYTTTPLFNSVLVENPTMTIPALMNNLPALPQVNEEEK